MLDEADQMADMGFLPIVREILDMTKPNGQRLLFSATLDGDVDTLRRKYLRNPAEHSTAPVHAQVEGMDHHVLLVHPADKDQVTAQIAARDGRTIFFVRTQAGVDRLADHLALQGVPVGALHGGKSQAVRTRTLDAFRNGITPALVATDVAARGIHVDGISLVVHVDSPTDPKDYLHRAGRTARAGETGTVVTLASPKQQRMVSSLTKRAGVDPYVARVRPGDQTLSDITGAQEPSGVPWIAPREKAAPRKAVDPSPRRRCWSLLRRRPRDESRPHRWRPTRGRGPVAAQASSSGWLSSSTTSAPHSADGVRQPEAVADRRADQQREQHGADARPCRRAASRARRPSPRCPAGRR